MEPLEATFTLELPLSSEASKLSLGRSIMDTVMTRKWLWGAVWEPDSIVGCWRLEMETSHAVIHPLYFQGKMFPSTC